MLLRMFLIFSLFATTVFAQGRNDTVIQTGDLMPDGDGEIDFFGRLSDLKNNGHVGFNAYSQEASGGFDGGTLYYDGVSTNLLARTNSPAPGGGTISHLDFIRINENGHALFFGRTMRGTTYSAFRSDGTTTELLWNEDHIAPNGDTYGRYFHMNLDDSGNVLLAAPTNTGSLIRSSIFRFGPGSSPATLIQSGDAAPDGNGIFANTRHRDSRSAFQMGRANERSAGVNSSGSIVFWGDLTNTTGGTADDSGIFRMDDQSLTQIARKGQISPDGDGTFLDFNSNHAVDVNERNSVMFWSFLDGTAAGATNDFGIFLHRNGQLESVVREGQSAAGGNGSYRLFGQTELNDIDQISFVAHLADTAGGTTDSLGFFRAGDGNIIELARTGDLIPDGTATLGGTGPLISIWKTQINNHGQAVYFSEITDTISMEEGNGIFVTDGLETVQVVRTGDQIDGVEIVHAGSTNDLGFNDHAQVAYVADLSNGSEVLQIWTPDLHWRSEVDGNWNDNSQWTLSIQPDSVHDVFIDPDASVLVSGPISSASIRSLRLGGGIGDATLELQAESKLEISEGMFISANGILTGNGEIAGLVSSDGVISPGISGTSAGAIEFSELTLNATSELQIELGGLLPEEFDRLIVTGDLAVDGELTLDLINGFSIVDGMQFEVISVGGLLSGQFSGIADGDLVSIFDGVGLYASYSGFQGNGFTLFAQSVPEPSSASIILVGLATLFFRRRVRRLQIA